MEIPTSSNENAKKKKKKRTILYCESVEFHECQVFSR